MSLLELTLEEQCIRIFLCSCLSIYTKVLSVPLSIETEKSERDQFNHELDERQQKIRRRKTFNEVAVKFHNLRVAPTRTHQLRCT